MNKVKLSIYIGIAFFCSNKIFAQTFFEDAEGKTSINLLNPTGSNSGLIRLNTANESFKLGYFRQVTNKKIILGIDISGKSNNGIAPIISQEKLSPEANFSLNFGIKNLTTKNINKGFDYLNIKLGYGAASYKMLSNNSSFDEQINSEIFNKTSISVSYNYFLNGNMLFGVSGGYERTNNINQLPKLKIRESTFVGSDTIGNINRSGYEEYTAWKGSLESIDQLSLYIDYLYFPDFLDNRIALSFYSRSNFHSAVNITNGGFGLYLNKSNKEPFKVVGGIIYEFSDVFNSKESSNSIGKRGTIGLILGYNL